MGLKAGAVAGWSSGLASRLSWVMSWTPRAVSPEPIHPMTPRYIIRMDPPMRGVNALPKTSTRSDDAVMAGLLMRNMYELMNVKATKPMPVKRVAYAIIIALSSIMGASVIQERTLT